MTGGAGVPALSRMVSPRTTNFAGSWMVEIDAGPIGADRSRHATPSAANTSMRIVACLRVTGFLEPSNEKRGERAVRLRRWVLGRAEHDRLPCREGFDRRLS